MNTSERSKYFDGGARSAAFLDYPRMEQEVLVCASGARIPEALVSSLGFDTLDWSVKAEGGTICALGYLCDDVLGTIEIVDSPKKKRETSIRIAGVDKETERIVSLEYVGTYPHNLKRADLSLRFEFPQTDWLKKFIARDITHAVTSGSIVDVKAGSQEVETAARITSGMLERSYGKDAGQYTLLHFISVHGYSQLQPLDHGSVTRKYICVGTNDTHFEVSNLPVAIRLGIPVWQIPIPRILPRGVSRGVRTA